MCNKLYLFIGILDDSVSNEKLEDSLNISGIFFSQPPTQLSALSTPKKNKSKFKSVNYN